MRVSLETGGMVRVSLGRLSLWTGGVVGCHWGQVVW